MDATCNSFVPQPPPPPSLPSFSTSNQPTLSESPLKANNSPSTLFKKVEKVDESVINESSTHIENICNETDYKPAPSTGLTTLQNCDEQIPSISRKKSDSNHEQMKDANSPKASSEHSSKPSRLQRAFSAHSLTLPSLRKSSKSSKSKGRNSISGESGEIEDSNPHKNDGAASTLRDASLWRLPGMMSTLKKKKGNSSQLEAGVVSKPDIPPKPADIGKSSQLQFSTMPSERNLPPLPSFHSSQRDLPPIPKSSFPSNSGIVSAASVYNKPNVGTCSHTNESMPENTAGKTSSKSSLEVSPSQSLASVANTAINTNVGPVTLTVSNMLKLYSKMFPLRFRCLQGYCSETSDVNISTGDIHDLHSVKQTNAVTIKDKDGTTYHIPLKAQMMFGLIFKQSSDSDEGLGGYTFTTISEVTSLSTLPKVICSTTAVKSNDDRFCVEENEIFVVCQVQRSMFKGKKGLKVFSLLSKSARVLPEDCSGEFSTNPSLVRMKLTDILDYVTNPFPSRAVMYPMTDSALTTQDYPGISKH